MSLRTTKSIKNVFILGILFISSVLTAQSFEIGAGAGTGAFYMIENADDNVNLSYTNEASIYVDLKYTFKDRNDGFKLRFQNMHVEINGTEYLSNVVLSGSVETFTTLLLYEFMPTEKNFNIGYNFGLGFTKQEYERFPSVIQFAPQDNYMSVAAGAITALKLNEKLFLRLETGLLWTDPINSFKGPANFQTAGEDLSLLVQLGLSYRF